MVDVLLHGSGQQAVYVVDDDPMIRRSLSFALNTAGFFVRLFVSGRDFVEVAPTLRPGCVLVDLRMPDVDGFAVLAALIDRRADLPIVVMTGHGDVATAVRAMKAGARDFIEKPWSDNALLATLESAFYTLVENPPGSVMRANAKGRLDTLTAREFEVLRALAGGLPNKVIADRLGLSVRTVEMHRSNMMLRLKLGSLADLLRIAFTAEVEPIS